MSVYGGPDIVTDGLLVYLDVADRKSYDGSDTWRDLNNSHDASLYNSPVFYPGVKGNLYFDGWNFNQYAILGNIPYNRTNFSVFAWFNFPEYHVGWRSIVVSKWNTGAGTALNEWSLGAWGANGPTPIGAGVQYDDTGRSLVVATPDNYVPNTWYNFGFVFDNGSLSLYKNGDIVNTDSSTGPITVWTSTQPIQIATFYSNPTNYAARINVSNVLMYNKSLSASEVKQNYNSLKGRYVL